jgi:hypothetical protein
VAGDTGVVVEDGSKAALHGFDIFKLIASILESIEQGLGQATERVAKIHGHLAHHAVGMMPLGLGSHRLMFARVCRRGVVLRRIVIVLRRRIIILQRIAVLLGRIVLGRRRIGCGRRLIVL